MSRVHISVSTEFFSAGVFDITLNDSLSSENVEQIFVLMSELIEKFKNENSFNYIATKNIMSEMIGEGGIVKSDPNLEFRNQDEICFIMEEMINGEYYKGFQFYIEKDDIESRISSNEEGSIERVKEKLC